jgi:uncharacterized damage-inducible protein DinB
MKADREVDAFWRLSKGSVDRIVACLEGLDQQDLNWKPLDNANSLYVLAVHVMANVSDNLLGQLCGQRVSRDREAEFKARGTGPEAMKQQWAELQTEITAELQKLRDTDLQSLHDHPRRGQISGVEIMANTARHAAEHMGQAEMTLDLLAAARGRPAVPRDAWGTPVRQ